MAETPAATQLSQNRILNLSMALEEARHSLEAIHPSLDIHVGRDGRSIYTEHDLQTSAPTPFSAVFLKCGDYIWKVRFEDSISLDDLKALIKQKAWEFCAWTPERIRALEALWLACKDPEFERVGYTPKIPEAVKRLRELERAQ